MFPLSRLLPNQANPQIPGTRGRTTSASNIVLPRLQVAVKTCRQSIVPTLVTTQWTGRKDWTKSNSLALWRPAARPEEHVQGTLHGTRIAPGGKLEVSPGLQGFCTHRKSLLYS